MTRDGTHTRTDLADQLRRLPHAVQRRMRVLSGRAAQIIIIIDR